MGDICVRISTIAKNFTGARATCRADGADIAYVPDRFAQQELKELIENKKNIYPHYDPVEVTQFVLELGNVVQAQSVTVTTLTVTVG